MALRFDGSEWWDTRVANFYEGDSADGSGGSSTGGADSSADGSGSSSESGGDGIGAQGFGGSQGFGASLEGAAPESGSFGASLEGAAPESSTFGGSIGDPSLGTFGGMVGGLSDEGTSIASIWSGYRDKFGGLFSGLVDMGKIASNPFGYGMRPGQQVSVARGMPVGTLDAAKGFADRQNAVGNRAGMVGGLAGSVVGGPIGAAIGETVGRVGAQTAMSVSNPSLASMTTGPFGTHDPEAVAEFSGMVSEAQPGLSNAGGSGSVILDEMRKRSGLPAIAPATYQRPAITSPQARAVYQNR